MINIIIQLLLFLSLNDFSFLSYIDIPETPTNLNLTSVTYSSISFKWQPGFDGGWSQTYLISLNNLLSKEINESFYTFSSKISNHFK